jgi:prepilin peptidase CpaA
MFSEAIPAGVQVLLLAVVLVAAVYDVRYRRIPNWISGLGILAGLVVNTVLQPVWPGFWFSLKGLLFGFGLYFLLYLLRAMGAGDVKLMGAVGAMAGAENWFGIFLITAILGGIMALILIVAKGRVKKTLWNVGFMISELTRGRAGYMRREELDVKSPKALGLPHGAVIAVGCIFFLALARLGR